MQPGDSMVVTITFEADADSEYVNRIRILSDRAEFVALEVVGSTLSSSEPQPLLPQELSLRVYPNPGNAEFRLSYSLSRSSAVNLRLYDVTGREVATLTDRTESAGEYVVPWNAASQASGIYFAVLSAGGATQMQKLVLMK